MSLPREEYIEIRHAQAKGARTIDDILKMTSIQADTPEKMKEIEIQLKKSKSLQKQGQSVDAASQS